MNARKNAVLHISSEQQFFKSESAQQKQQNLNEVADIKAPLEINNW